MKPLSKQLYKLKADISTKIDKLIEKKGIDYNGNKAIIVHDTGWSVCGNLITHITDEFVIAEGYHYDFFAMDIEELINLIESLE